MAFTWVGGYHKTGSQRYNTLLATTALALSMLRLTEPCVHCILTRTPAFRALSFDRVIWNRRIPTADAGTSLSNVLVNDDPFAQMFNPWYDD
jgi:hypothetical protein